MQVRSVPAIASDAIYCQNLGATAVHGAMSGYTGFSVGRVNMRYVYIPIDEMTHPDIKVCACARARACAPVNDCMHACMRVYTLA